MLLICCAQRSCLDLVREVVIGKLVDVLWLAAQDLSSEVSENVVKTLGDLELLGILILASLIHYKRKGLIADA